MERPGVEESGEGPGAGGRGHLPIEVMGAAFGGLMERAADFIFLLDDAHRILDASRSACEALAAGEDVRGRDFADLLDSDSRARARAFLGGLAEGAGTVELAHHAAGGTPRPVAYTFCRVVPEGGGPTLIGVGRDREGSRDVVERLVRANRELEETRRALVEQAMTDALTGLGNRRWFLDQLDTLWASADRLGRLPWVIMADLDQFKPINDTYGHQAGDEVLKAAARALAGSVRGGDLAARYGGEEFVLAGLGQEESQVRAIAERLLESVRGLRIDLGGEAIRLTVSLGAVLVESARERPPRAALEAADRALYRAKAGGRDRYEVRTDASPDPSSAADQGHPAPRLRARLP